MPIIRRAVRLTNTRSQLVGGSLFDEFVVDEELNFNAAARIAVINGPSGNRLGVSAIQRTVQRGVGRNQKQSGCNCCDQ